MGNLKKYLKDKQSKKDKKEITISYNKVVDVLNLEVEKMGKIIQSMQDKYNIEEIPVLVNQFLFFRITFKDIIGLIKQLQKTSDEQELNLTTRSLAVHLYEFLDDTQDFLGPKMRQNLIALKLPNEDFLINDLNDVKELHKALKNQTLKELAEIRNNVGAHKEQNSLILNNKIKNIKQKDIEIYCMLSFTLFISIFHFQNNIINSISFLIEKYGENYFQEKIENDKNVVTDLKLRSVKAMFAKTQMIFMGRDPEMAEILCELSQEEIKRLLNKLEELKEYINQKNKNSQT